MRRRFGLSVAVIVSLNGCVDDPTFQQVDAGDADASGEAGSGSSSSGGSSSSSSSSGGSSSSSSGTPEGRCKTNTCAFAGGTCSGDTCVIACPGNNNGIACNTEIHCPAGADCKVTCSGNGACKKVTCDGATSCSVTCDGQQACSDQIELDSASSTLVCTGKDACKKPRCDGAVCAVTCNPAACETKDVKCCASSCTVNGAKGECK